VLETGPTKHPFSPSHEVRPRSGAHGTRASRTVTLAAGAGAPRPPGQHTLVVAV